MYATSYKLSKALQNFFIPFHKQFPSLDKLCANSSLSLCLFNNPATSMQHPWSLVPKEEGLVLDIEVSSIDVCSKLVPMSPLKETLTQLTQIKLATSIPREVKEENKTCQFSFHRGKTIFLVYRNQSTTQLASHNKQFATRSPLFRIYPA